jgi:hypothetical protein
MTTMTSERKAASNRRNAQESTGPKSDVGRRHSRRNAFRQGLAVAIGTDPSFSKEIEGLAATLASGSGGQTIGEFARQAAEAEIDLLRIRRLGHRGLMPPSAIRAQSFRIISNSTRAWRSWSGMSDALSRDATVPYAQ